MAVETPHTRRRVLTVAAAFAAAVPTRAWAKSVPAPTVWRGVALGAEAEIRLVHHNVRVAEDVLKSCVEEVRRLEAIFSLYQPESTLSRLNRTGRVTAPELELVDLLGTAFRITEETSGAFDVSLQALWQVYAQHLNGAGPSSAEVQRARTLIGSGHIHLSPREIILQRKGMALTLNGIAQGYVTDRIRDRLHQGGFNDVLIDLGEIYAGGTRPDGSPWQVGLSDAAKPKTLIKRLTLSNRALASSSDAGLTLSAGDRITHLIDPRTGQSPRRYKSVSVTAENAETADALSTAFALMPVSEIEKVVAHRKGVDVTVFRHDGRSVSFSAG